MAVALGIPGRFFIVDSTMVVEVWCTRGSVCKTGHWSLVTQETKLKLGLTENCEYCTYSF